MKHTFLGNLCRVIEALGIQGGKKTVQIRARSKSSGRRKMKVLTKVSEEKVKRAS